jgi:hypothetical protein
VVESHSDNEAVARLQTVAVARSALDRRCRAAFKARARGTVAARRSVAQHVAPVGDGALTRGPRHRKKETDKWDPVAEYFQIKNTPERM